MKGTSLNFIYFTCNLMYEHTQYYCLSSGTHILVQYVRLWLNIHHIPQYDQDCSNCSNCSNMYEYKLESKSLLGII